MPDEENGGTRHNDRIVEEIPDDADMGNYFVFGEAEGPQPASEDSEPGGSLQSLAAEAGSLPDEEVLTLARQLAQATASPEEIANPEEARAFVRRTLEGGNPSPEEEENPNAG